MDDLLEQGIREMLKQRRYGIIVAIITDRPNDEKNRNRERAKMHFRQQDQEILSCNHPTLTHDESDGYAMTFIFGVRDYMKDEEEYLEKFLNACRGHKERIEIVGIKSH